MPTTRTISIRSFYGKSHRSVERLGSSVDSKQPNMVAADTGLTAAATEAGIDLATDPVLKYLRAIKITASSAISVYFQDDTGYRLGQEARKGKITYKGNDYDLSGEDVNTVTAQWKVLYAEIRAQYQKRLSATTTSGTSTTPAPTATSTPADKDTVPKTLPPGVYTQLIKDYNNFTLDGEKRSFPEKILLGADKVLARMCHEHHTSKHYTAVTLGEIMSPPVFTSLGTVNSNRKKDDLDKRLIVDNKQQLVTKEPPDWDVRGASMMQDGIEAVKWAWILIVVAARGRLQGLSLGRAVPNAGLCPCLCPCGLFHLCALPLHGCVLLYCCGGGA